MSVLDLFFAATEECARCGATDDLIPVAYDEVTGDAYLFLCPRCKREKEEEARESARKARERQLRWDYFDRTDGFPG